MIIFCAHEFNFEIEVPARKFENESRYYLQEFKPVIIPKMKGFLFGNYVRFVLPSSLVSISSALFLHPLEKVHEINTAV